MNSNQPSLVRATDASGRASEAAGESSRSRAIKPKRPRIVCGTDFSVNAHNATDVAAAIAIRLRARLALVHVADETNARASKAAEFQSFVRPIKAELRKEAQRLRALGATVDEVILHGKWAEQAILEYLESNPADLVVVSSVSKTAFDRWTLGSVSERIAERSAVPTLVVRAPGRLLEWARRDRTLNVFVAVDFSVSSDAALAWVRQLKAIGACAVTIAHVNWPPDEYRWLAPGSPLPLTRNVPAVHRRLSRDLLKKVQAWLGDGNVTIRVEPNWGRPDAALVTAAAEADADLIITGSRQQNGVSQVAHVSISRGILRHASTNVVCVPTPIAVAHGVGCHLRIRRVLAATDFSAHGDQAIAWAYAALPAGGVVRLVHVLPPRERPSTRTEYRRLVAKAQRKLAALIPADAMANGVRTELEVVSDRNPARAISGEARRFGPDLLCLGSRGHGALAEALLGSVARRVIAESPEPVLLVRQSRH